MYTIDWHLKKWMQENLIQNTAIVIDIDNGTVKDALYINLAKDENLVKYIRTQGNAMIFHLTSQGEIALGIQAAETPASPLTGAREAGGVLATVEEAYELGDYVKHQNGYEIYRYANHYYAYYNGIKQHDGIALVLVERWIDNQQLPATPPTATEGAGDGSGADMYMLEYNGNAHIIKNKAGKTITFLRPDQAIEAELMLSMLNIETHKLQAKLDALTKYADGLAAENSALGIVISSVGIKVNDARDLLFAEKYAAADGELKNAQVIIQRNNKDALD